MVVGALTTASFGRRLVVVVGAAGRTGNIAQRTRWMMYFDAAVVVDLLHVDTAEIVAVQLLEASAGEESDSSVAAAVARTLMGWELLYAAFRWSQLMVDANDQPQEAYCVRPFFSSSLLETLFSLILTISLTTRRHFYVRGW